MPSLRRMAGLGATAVLVTAVLGFGAGTALAAYPGENGKIVYACLDYDGPTYITSKLCQLDSETDDQPTELTQGLNNVPRYSPGGAYIVNVDKGRCGEGEIVLRDGAGVFIRTLASSPGCTIFNDLPSWAPDGSRIVFARQQFLYTVRPDGTGLTQLTSEQATTPAWSPDGTRIAFSSFRGSAWNLYLLDLTKTGPERLVQLTNNTFGGPEDGFPEWSPDGETLIWTRWGNSGSQLFRMSPVEAGVTPEPFLAGGPEKSNPVFSPDGTRLLFDSGSTPGDNEIFTVDAEGSEIPTPITHSVDDKSFGATWQPIPEFPLVDARFSSFESDIRWIYQSDIASGCSLERYCPENKVTRGQMAVFLDRALDLPPATDDYFTDDAGRTFEGAINRVREAGIAFGCTASTYCPDASVTRGQMASFLDRAFDPDATGQDYFTDDEGRSFEGAVDRLRAAGIAFGCTATTYCPDLAVRRGQMAAFLHRALAP